MVSIIIPYFNRPEKLKRCLFSVIGQTYQDFEILVVDDCSTVPLVIDIDPRIKVFRNNKNLGPGLSRNVGLDNAKGKYVSFLDSDDYWHEEFLETMMSSLMLNPNAVMTYAEGYKVSVNGELIGKRRSKKQPPSCILPNILFQGRYWGTGGCLWRKNEILCVRFLDTRSWEDYVFDISVAINNNNIVSVNKYLVYYDASGKDKLSNQQHSKAIVEKHKSINVISDSLFNSKFREYFEVRQAIQILLINHMISIIRHKTQDNKLIKRTIIEFEKWSSKNIVWCIRFLNYFPTSFQLRTLRYLKSRIRS